MASDRLGLQPRKACQNPAIQFVKDLNLSAFTAGFVAELVGFTSSVAIVFQAAQAFGATPAQITSWRWPLGLGMGLCSALPSLWLRKPVMVAWSTPGAAVLATAGLAGGFSMNEAVGAFMVSAALILLFGVTGWFEKVMNRIPVAIASALLAGVLARFGIEAFAAAKTALPLVLLMLLIYLLGKRLMPRYAVVLTLLGAIVYVAARGHLDWTSVTFSFAMPVFVVPHFTFAAAVSLAVPLFVVTMASQNLPGVAAIRAAGYGLDAPDGGEDESHREAALITSLVTLSCVVIAGVGSAFWGGAALFVQQYGQQRRMPVSGSASTTQAAGPLRNP